MAKRTHARTFTQLVADNVGMAIPRKGSAGSANARRMLAREVRDERRYDPARQLRKIQGKVINLTAPGKKESKATPPRKKAAKKKPGARMPSPEKKGDRKKAVKKKAVKKKAVKRRGAQQRPRRRNVTSKTLVVNGRRVKVGPATGRNSRHGGKG